ncbi:MAG: 3-phosphoshikimate 1-carboxyvinyltransferase, partial [Spirochaetaceae bacterium]
GDHRVAMAMAIGALGAESPITIHNAGVAEITYPGFFEMLDSLRL